jgi:hypothetical protein
MTRRRVRLPERITDELTIENLVGIIAGLVMITIVILSALGY